MSGGELQEKSARSALNEKLVRSLVKPIREPAAVFLEKPSPLPDTEAAHSRAHQMVIELNAVVSMVPPPCQQHLFAQLLRKHRMFAWFGWGRYRRKFNADLALAKRFAHVSKTPAEAFNELSLLKFSTITRKDSQRVASAAVFQTLCSAFILWRKDPDWAVAVEGVALLVATYLLAKCESIDQQLWNKIMTAASVFAAATGIALILTK